MNGIVNLALGGIPQLGNEVAGVFVACTNRPGEFDDADGRQIRRGPVCGVLDTVCGEVVGEKRSDLPGRIYRICLFERL